MFPSKWNANTIPVPTVHSEFGGQSIAKCAANLHGVREWSTEHARRVDGHCDVLGDEERTIAIAVDGKISI